MGGGGTTGHDLVGGEGTTGHDLVGEELPLDMI